MNLTERNSMAITSLYPAQKLQKGHRIQNMQKDNNLEEEEIKKNKEYIHNVLIATKKT